MVSQTTGDDKPHVNTQLHRWEVSGKLQRLRKGVYCFAPPYTREEPSRAVVANSLYRPSYITGLWALAYYGLIPELVSIYTSATTRATRRFSNPLGIFHYSHLGTRFFFGFRPVEIAGETVMLAEPEKALIDLWHLNRKPWTSARFAEMRFQNTDIVDAKKLENYARQCDSPRLIRASRQWLELAATEDSR
jgi:predicted transcriptional regulator of viral defense system